MSRHRPGLLDAVRSANFAYDDACSAAVAYAIRAEFSHRPCRKPRHPKTAAGGEPARLARRRGQLRLTLAAPCTVQRPDAKDMNRHARPSGRHVGKPRWPTGRELVVDRARQGLWS